MPGVVKIYPRRKKLEEPVEGGHIHCRKTRARLVAEGAMKNEEDGFMQGYEEGLEDAEKVEDPEEEYEKFIEAF